MSVPERTQFAHFLRMPVRWRDMDALSHVNNAEYFTYDESARIDFFQELIDADPGFWTEHGLILAAIGAQFLRQLRPPATIDIGFRIVRIGNSSMQSQSCIWHGDEAVALVEGRICWFDYRAQRTARVPEQVRAYIRARCAVPPVEASAAG